MALGLNQQPNQWTQTPGAMSLRGPVDITVQKPAPGQPLSASQVTIAPRTAPATSPASTVDIPPPQLVAPWLYSPAKHHPGNYFQNNQTNYFNGPGGQQSQTGLSTPTPPPSLPSMPPPALPPAPPPPMSQMPGQQPPAMPPQQPPTPPPSQMPPEPPVGNTPPSEPSESPLNGQVVSQINARLENRNETVRADAAMDFFKLLEGDPKLSEDPKWQADISAFLTKIMHDPSPVVRQGGLMALEMGYVSHPDADTMATLQELAEKNGLFGIESEQASNILGSLNEKISQEMQVGQPQGDTGKMPQPEPNGQQLNLVSNQQDLVPANGRGGGPPPPQLDITSMALTPGGGHGA